jgi:MAF protein
MVAMQGTSANLADRPTLPLLVLASASPRRREILSRAWSGRLEVLPSGIDEGEPKAGEAISKYAMRLASAKARSVAAGSAPALVIAADTVVELDGRPMGKPETGHQASKMLNALRGRSHAVTTGLAVIAPGCGDMLSGHETTTVHMRRYTSDEIDRYVSSGEPFDKAGGYAVQDPDFDPAQLVQGCYLNVVGLPLCRLSELMAKVTPGFGNSMVLGSCASCSTSAVREEAKAV